jgi:hypothetical protein
MRLSRSSVGGSAADEEVVLAHIADHPASRLHELLALELEGSPD